MQFVYHFQINLKIWNILIQMNCRKLQHFYSVKYCIPHQTSQCIHFSSNLRHENCSVGVISSIINLFSSQNTFIPSTSALCKALKRQPLTLLSHISFSQQVHVYTYTHLIFTLMSLCSLILLYHFIVITLVECCMLLL